MKVRIEYMHDFVVVPLSNATIAGSKCLIVPLTEACKFLGQLIIHAQGEQIPHLYGPLHAK